MWYGCPPLCWHLAYGQAAGTDGFELCRKIRVRVDCPIVFLTAKTDESSLVYGLGMGADDYICKPFGAMELRARVNAHLRREGREAADRIAGAQEVSREMNPDLCQYVIFDENGEVRDGNIETVGMEDAWSAVQGQKSDAKGHYYRVIPRGTGYCVLRYMITPQYSSSVLRRYLPQPQNWLFAAGLCLILLLVVLTALCFGHTLRKKLAPLILTAEKIQNQELEFDIQSSDIQEISAVLKAMDDMRAALKTSLESQWELEQCKKLTRHPFCRKSKNRLSDYVS